MDVEVVPLH